MLGSFLADYFFDRGARRNSSLAYHAADAGLVAQGQAPGRRAAARAAPRRADLLLLPDARLAVRGRGCSPGDDGPRLARPGSFREARGAALVALSNRDERLPRHAERPRGPRPRSEEHTSELQSPDHL